MTDEELIRRLRGPQSAEVDYATRQEGADRIEALVREMASGSFYKEADIDALMAERDRAKANLTKAVGALTRIASAQPRPMRSGGYEGHDVSNMQRTARAALAEIEGKP
jgi:hypothetical protein